MSDSHRTIINVVSGKGGTGKTLFACVLADMLGNAPDAATLVVDLDVFVRGLTSLLYYHREEKLSIARRDEVAVADLFVRKMKDDNLQRLAIAKYRSFEVVPAVSRIDQELNFQDIGPNNRNEAKAIIGNLLQWIPDRYRFVILDSRAGYDELIAATHELSDVSVAVEEHDPIARVTADNLIAQLRRVCDTPLFRLVNKARGISSEEQLDQDVRSVTDLGLIPFDMDVMNAFGSKDFWDEISHSLYRSALARAWNRLAGKMQLGVNLGVPRRVSPIGSERLEARTGLLSWRKRVLLVYGLLLAGLGISYGLLGASVFEMLREEPLRFASLLIGVVGLGVALFAILVGGLGSKR